MTVIRLSEPAREEVRRILAEDRAARAASAAAVTRPVRWFVRQREVRAARDCDERGSPFGAIGEGTIIR